MLVIGAEVSFTWSTGFERQWTHRRRDMSYKWFQ